MPRLWQSVLKSSDHLTSSPDGTHNVVSCTGCSSGQLEKDRNGVTPCCLLGRDCLCLASLGVPALGCCHLIGQRSPILSPLQSHHPALWALLSCCPIAWIPEATVEATQGLLPFCDSGGNDRMVRGPWSGRHVSMWLFPSNPLQLPCSLVWDRQQAVFQPLATTGAFNSSAQEPCQRIHELFGNHHPPR